MYGGVFNCKSLSWQMAMPKRIFWQWGQSTIVKTEVLWEEGAPLDPWCKELLDRVRADQEKTNTPWFRHSRDPPTCIPPVGSRLYYRYINWYSTDWLTYLLKHWLPDILPIQKAPSCQNGVVCQRWLSRPTRRSTGLHLAKGQKRNPSPKRVTPFSNTHFPPAFSSFFCFGCFFPYWWKRCFCPIVGGEGYLLLDLNQCLLPYESNTLTIELK